MRTKAGNQRASAALLAACCGALLACIGCATPYQTAGLAVAGVAAAGSAVPAHELEQIYYLGVFDPEGQMPPTVYRLTVRGQASILSGTDFASGWVPAPLIDSLNARIGFDTEGSGSVQCSQTSTNQTANLATGRRLLLFGPEGFREVPRDYRLVVVMGADPKAFFSAVDRALGVISGVAIQPANTALEKKLFKALVTASSSRENLSRLKNDVAQDLPRRSDP